MKQNTVVQAAWGSYVAKSDHKQPRSNSSKRGITHRSRQELREALASALMQKLV